MFFSSNSEFYHWRNEHKIKQKGAKGAKRVPFFLFFFDCCFHFFCFHSDLYQNRSSSFTMLSMQKGPSLASLIRQLPSFPQRIRYGTAGKLFLFPSFLLSFISSLFFPPYRFQKPPRPDRGHFLPNRHHRLLTKCLSWRSGCRCHGHSLS